MAEPSDEWRPVPGFPGYEANRRGECRSYRTTKGLIQRSRVLHLATTPHVLTPFQPSPGHFYYSLCQGTTGRSTTLSVERLVRLTFPELTEADRG